MEHHGHVRKPRLAALTAPQRRAQLSQPRPQTYNEVMLDHPATTKPAQIRRTTHSPQNNRKNKFLSLSHQVLRLSVMQQKLTGTKKNQRRWEENKGTNKEGYSYRNRKRQKPEESDLEYHKRF